MSRILGLLGLGAAMTLSAHADTADQTASGGEILAWTVAAYASCETPDELAADFREETTRQESTVVDVLAAMRILKDAGNVCELKQTFASDMLDLAVHDMSAFEAKLMWSETPNTPVFEIEEPKGSPEPELSIIVTAAGDIPPPTSASPQASDYVE